MFGVVAILGPIVGPVVGGWLTENISWHYAFFLNVPVSAVLITLLLIGLPAQKSNLHLIGEADWLGIAGLTLGMGGLTVFLEEGAREEWFSSEMIRWMAGISVFGFILLFLGQWFARRPVIKLRLLLNRQFASIIVMAMALGMVLYGTSYAIPQFLSSIADYNALQSGQIVMLSGIPSIMLMPFLPRLVRVIDIRLAVGFGMATLALSAWMETNLTIESVGGDFIDSQLMRGVGTILGMLFLSQACVQSVPPEDAGDASGLFNAARNLGGSFVLAGISILQQDRMWFHSRRLEETLNANTTAVQDYVHTLSQSYGGDMGAIRMIGNQIQQQALTMTYNDIFFAMSAVTMGVMPLILLLRPLAKDAPKAAMH